MQKYKCECCGASLKRSTMKIDEYVCEYCGTRYKRDHEYLPPIRIETFQSPVQILKCKCYVEDSMIKNLGEDDAAEITLKRLANQFANSLIPFMNVETEYDPMTMSNVVTAKLRVVENNYSF